MKKTMKAAVLHKIGDKLRIEQVPVPTPGRGDVLIKVIACGVCHSDLQAIDGDWQPLPTLPLSPGHEVAGHVAALGEGVTDLKVGDAVGVPWIQRLRQEARHGGMRPSARRETSGCETQRLCRSGGRRRLVARLPGTPTSSWRSCAPASPLSPEHQRTAPASGRPSSASANQPHRRNRRAVMGFRLAAVDVADSSPTKLASRQRPRERAAGAAGQDRRRPRRDRHCRCAAGVQQAIATLRPRRRSGHRPARRQGRDRASISAITNWELTARLQRRNQARPRRSRRLCRQRPGDRQDQEGAAGTDQRYFRRHARGKIWDAWY
jgi:hypothetical protein